MQSLNQNILATIVVALNAPTKLVMTKTVFNYQFIYYSSPLSKIMKKQRLFLAACENNEVDVVRLLLHYVDPSCEENRAIIWASENGHLEVVKLLLGNEKTNPADLNNIAISLASHNGHLEIVRLLLADERVNPSDKYNAAIFWAEKNNHLEVVKLLLEDKRVSRTYIPSQK